MAVIMLCCMLWLTLKQNGYLGLKLECSCEKEGGAASNCREQRPGWHSTKKCGPPTYNHKERACTNNLNELGSGLGLMTSR